MNWKMKPNEAETVAPQERDWLSAVVSTWAGEDWAHQFWLNWFKSQSESWDRDPSGRFVPPSWTLDTWADSNHLNTFQISYILYLSDYRDLKINDWYVYPGWAYVLGWMMTFSSAIMVPLWVVIHLCSTTGSFREVCGHLSRGSVRRCVSSWSIFVRFQRLAAGCRAVEDPAWQEKPTDVDGADVELMTPAAKAWLSEKKSPT